MASVVGRHGEEVAHDNGQLATVHYAIDDVEDDESLQLFLSGGVMEEQQRAREEVIVEIFEPLELVDEAALEQIPDGLARRLWNLRGIGLRCAELLRSLLLEWIRLIRPQQQQNAIRMEK